jgi:hypothetical protein
MSMDNENEMKDKNTNQMDKKVVGVINDFLDDIKRKQQKMEVDTMEETISKGLSEDGMVRKLKENIDFLIIDIVSEKTHYEKTHELLKTLKDASVTVVDPETAMIKLAVDNYFDRMEMEKSKLPNIVEDLYRLKEYIDVFFGLMQARCNKMVADATISAANVEKAAKQESTPGKLKIKTIVTEVGPIDLSKVRRDPGKTIAKDGEIPIRENVVAELKESGDKEVYQLLQIMREFFPEQKDNTVKQYLRSHMKYLGKELRTITKKDISMAKNQKVTKEKTVTKKQTVVEKPIKKYPSKIKGTQIKGKIAKGIEKSYNTTLTEERYIAVLQTVRDNPGILDDSTGKTARLSKNSAYAHLLLGVHEKVGDLTMKSRRYTITEQGMKTLRHLEKDQSKKGKEIEKEQKAKVTEKLKETLVAPLEDDKKIVQTPRKKTAEDEALDKKYAMSAKAIAAKSEKTGKKYLMDIDALHIYKTYRITIEQSILEELQKRIKEAFNYRTTFVQLAESTKNQKSIVDAHVRYGIRKKMFAPCGLDEKGKPEVCGYEHRDEVVALKEKKENIIKVQSKSILDGENKEAEGTSLWKKIRGEKNKQ